MGKGSKKGAPSTQVPQTGPFNNPFAQLAAHRAGLPSAPVAEPASVSPAPNEIKGPARAVVRLERKGHGGKEVTVVEHLGLDEGALWVWLKALKQSLGCGGSVEEGALHLQGDQRERLPVLLEKRGVRKVVIG